MIFPGQSFGSLFHPTPLSLCIFYVIFGFPVKKLYYLLKKHAFFLTNQKSVPNSDKIQFGLKVTKKFHDKTHLRRNALRKIVTKLHATKFSDKIQVF